MAKDHNSIVVVGSQLTFLVDDPTCMKYRHGMFEPKAAGYKHSMSTRSILETCISFDPFLTLLWPQNGPLLSLFISCGGPKWATMGSNGRNHLFEHSKWSRNNFLKTSLTTFDPQGTPWEPYPSACSGIDRCGWRGNDLQLLPFIIIRHHKGAQGNTGQSNSANGGETSNTRQKGHFEGSFGPFFLSPKRGLWASWVKKLLDNAPRYFIA